MEKLGHWTSNVDRLKYIKAYSEALLTMPAAKSMLIETNFGTIQVYCWQNENIEYKKPILLLPGRSSGTPMWAANIKDLVKGRTIYAFDALGDAGLSIQKTGIKDSIDQSLWINETVEKLGLSKIHIIGHSFGGWLAANYASQYSEKVLTLSLLEPVFTFRYIKVRLILKSIPYNLKFLPKKWRQGLLQEISGVNSIDQNDPVAKMVEDATNYFVSKLPIPKLITKEEREEWNFPVFVALGGKSPLHNAEKCLEVAQRDIKNVDAKIWKDATHSLPMECAKEINKQLIAFISKNE